MSLSIRPYHFCCCIKRVSQLNEREKVTERNRHHKVWSPAHQLRGAFWVVMINFRWQWFRGDTFLRDKAFTASVFNRRAVVIVTMKLADGWPHKPFPMRHLLLTQAPYFCRFIWEKKRTGDLICLSSWYDSQRGKSSRELVSSVWFSAFNTLFIIKHAPGFIFFCLAVGQ